MQLLLTATHGLYVYKNIINQNSKIRQFSQKAKANYGYFKNASSVTSSNI